VLFPLDRAPALAALGGFALAGILVPGVVTRLGREGGRRLVAARAELGARLTDGVQGVGEILASVEKRREETRMLEDRLNEIVARIVSAEQMGAPERFPRELALAQAELRYARHASTDGGFDVQEAETSILRAEKAADLLLERLNARSS